MSTDERSNASQRDDEPSSELAQLLRGSERASEEASDADHETQFFCFRLGGTRFAFPADSVTEVLRPVDPTPVPHTPTHVPGVINRQSRVTAVLDLAMYVGENVEEAPRRLAVIASDDLEAAVPVTEIVGLHAFTAAQIAPPPREISEMGPFIVGHVVADSDIFLIIDVDRLLDGAQHFPQAGAAALEA